VWIDVASVKHYLNAIKAKQSALNARKPLVGGREPRLCSQPFGLELIGIHHLLPSDLTSAHVQRSPSSASSRGAVVVPADTVLEALDDAGSWWSEDDERSRTRDVGVAAQLPDAADPLRRQRRCGLEAWADGDGTVACQAYLLPVRSPGPAAAVKCDDDDEIVEEGEEFRWVFSSSDEDDREEEQQHRLLDARQHGAVLVQVAYTT